MLLRELTKGGFPVSLPAPGGADDPKAPKSRPTSWDAAVLVGVSAAMDEPELVDARTGDVKTGVVLEMRLEDEWYREVLEWDGPANAPTPERLANKLRPHLGARMAEIYAVDVGEAAPPPVFD